MPTWTQSINVSTSSGSLQGFSGSVSDTGNSQLFPATQLQFSANTNSGNFSMNFTASLVQALFIIASQNCVLTTNNSTSPTNTLNLTAGIPVNWSRSANTFAQPLNANTNAGFMTCNAATSLTIGILSN